MFGSCVLSFFCYLYCQSTCLSVRSFFSSSCRNQLIFEHSVLLCEMSSVVLVTDSGSRPYNYVSNVVMKFTISEISNDDIYVLCNGSSVSINFDARVWFSGQAEQMNLPFGI